MGRKANTVPGPQKTKMVEKEAVGAAGQMLGFAMRVAHCDNPAEAADKMSGMAELCDMAADHMALAHNLLVTHVDHTDTAIEHLDAALNCLQKITPEGAEQEAMQSGEGAKEARDTKSA